jgi:hypothetical protein
MAATVTLALWLASPAGGVTEQEIRDHIRSSFVPTRPAVTIKYNVSYRFMGFNLMKMAVATIETVEGRWNSDSNNVGIPVCMAEFRFDTVEDGAGGDRGRVFLRDSMLSVLTMPDLDTLWYVRRANERIAMPLMSRKEVNYLDAYDLENGSLSYYREDFMSGTVTTNLPGGQSFADQGRDISSMVKIISSIYHGKRSLIEASEPYLIRANINGVIRSLAVTAKDAQSPVRLGGVHPGSIRISVREMDGEKAGDECFVLWASSFRDIAGKTSDSSLVGIANMSPAWSMIPLATDYTLCIGSIRCSMTAIGLSGDTVLTASSSGRSYLDVQPGVISLIAPTR